MQTSIVGEELTDNAIRFAARVLEAYEEAERRTKTMVIYAFGVSGVTRITCYGWHNIRLTDYSRKRLMPVLCLDDNCLRRTANGRLVSVDVIDRNVSRRGWMGRKWGND